MADRFHSRRVTAVVVAAIGISALAGCAGVSPAPPRTTLTLDSAGAHYEASACRLDAADDAFSVALLNAEQSVDDTGPDLDSLKAAALEYRKAARAAVSHLGDRTIVWPGSVRKSIAVLMTQLRSMTSPLGEMATANRMSEEQTRFKDLPDNSKMAAAVTRIHSKLGLPSDLSESCPGPKPATLSVPPATGILIAGTGYTFHAPAGWTRPPTPVSADAYAISAQPDANGVYDTMNVLTGTPNPDALDDQERDGAQYLEQDVGATQVKIRPRVEIGGEESLHISALLVHQGVTAWTEQYSVTHGGTAFLITFDFHQSESQTDREALADSVLAGWNWD